MLEERSSASDMRVHRNLEPQRSTEEKAQAGILERDPWVERTK
jgi:PBP1b-binding outer membrane lipoprotein LpoB